MKTQKFGIEIELTGITREITGDIIAEYFGTKNHSVESTFETEDRKGRIWKIVHDSSIYSQKNAREILVEAEERYKVEVVSPILSYDDIKDLQEIVRQLRQKGALVNKSCGIHIHVNTTPHTPTTLKNLVNIMASKEEILYKSLRIAPERLRYCKRVNEKLMEAINKKKPKTLQELADIWYSDNPYDNRTSSNNYSRYRGLNLHSTYTKGTVEFRIFNSTLDEGEIKAYIQFCLAVSHQALSQRSASAKRTVTNNEKYTFRCWMLRLGLNGDEFKTCRHHFLKNLSGDSAWR